MVILSLAKRSIQLQRGPPLSLVMTKTSNQQSDRCAAGKSCTKLNKSSTASGRGSDVRRLLERLRIEIFSSESETYSVAYNGTRHRRVTIDRWI
jgi:hypothetical protein